jgi:hypothetical protein
MEEKGGESEGVGERGTSFEKGKGRRKKEGEGVPD